MTYDNNNRMAYDQLEERANRIISELQKQLKEKTKEVDELKKKKT